MEPERMIERLAAQRLGCVRSAVLGSSGGIIATASLIVGIAAAGGSMNEILRAGVIGMIGGAMAMAACQFLVASRRRDGHAPEVQPQLAAAGPVPEMDLVEVAAIYRQRGLSEDMAMEAAWAVSNRDEGRPVAGSGDTYCAGPVQAALTTAVTFAIAAALPLGFAPMFRFDEVAPGVALTALACLLVVMLAGSRRVGLPLGRGTVRVVIWGTAALALCYVVGRMFDFSGI